MPVMNHKLTTLSMFVSLEGNEEREINRDLLVYVAPDREEFLRSAASIEEIRHSLKLLGNSTSLHWLYQTQKKCEFKVKDTSTRFSAFSPPSAGDKTDQNATTVECKAIRRAARRRVLSTSAINKNINIKGLWFPPAYDFAGPLDVSPPLSTSDRLISPRPLGPTHILIVYATQPSKNSLSFIQKRDPSNTFRDTRRRTMIAPTYPEVVEIPINDLLFLLSVPNLMPPPTKTNRGSVHELAVLPPRLHKEMPRVMMQVPHLETFQELVIYLHTKNLAALFRNIIPEWIRDAIHPLPPAPLPTPAHPLSEPDSVSAFSFDGLNIKKLLGKLVPESLPFSLGMHAAPVRTLASVAVELAGVCVELDAGGDDDLLSTAAQLTALRNNLHHIGYYDKDLWSELISYRSILLQAISHCANIDVIAPY